MKNFVYKPTYQEYAYMYIISDNNGYMKIGIAKDPEKRVKQLQTGHATKLDILFTEEFYCRRSHLLKIEKLVHRKIRSMTPRMKGEWFEIPMEDLEEVKTIITIHRIQYEDNEIALKYGLSIF